MKDRRDAHDAHAQSLRYVKIIGFTGMFGVEATHSPLSSQQSHASSVDMRSAALFPCLDTLYIGVNRLLSSQSARSAAAAVRSLALRM